MKENFTAAKRLVPKDDSEYSNRIRVLEILAKVNEQKIIDENFESNILKDVKWVPI